MRCPVCQHNIPEGYAFCTNCGSPAPSQTAYAAPSQYETAPAAAPYEAPAASLYEAPTAPAKKAGKFPVKALLIGVSAVVVIAMLALLLLNVFARPVVQLGNALKRTADAGNFTMEAKVGGDQISLKMDINYKDEELIAIGEEEGQIVMVIYDERQYTYYEDDDTWVYEDCSDTLDSIFEGYEKIDELWGKDLETILDELDLLDPVEDFADVKELKKALKEISKTSWLKENAGYSSETKGGEKLHIFEIDVYDLLSSLLDAAEPAIEDDDFEEYLSRLLSQYTSSAEVELTVTVGIKWGYISSLTLEAAEEIEIEISDVNKTKIDVEELEEMLEDAVDSDEYWDRVYSWD